MHSLMNYPGLTFSLLCCAAAGAFWYAWRREQRHTAALKMEIADLRDRQQREEIQSAHRVQLDSVRNEFISTVSHELRTPLTSIRGALGLLSAGLMGTLDTKGHKLLRIAITNTDRLIRLVSDILDLERLESGRAPLVMQRCSLGDLVTQAIDTMSPMADTAQVTLEFSPQEIVTGQAALASTPPEILPAMAPGDDDRRTGQRRSASLPGQDRRSSDRRAGDERRRGTRNVGAPAPLYFDGEADRILQVLINLFSNAIKFSPPLSTVAIHVEASPNLLHLRVSDQGRGIPQEKLETVFDRFQQLEKTDSKEKGGTGLGLAICRSIIQQHGGAIWAQRNPTEGVSLCVDLPRSNRSTDGLPSSVKPVPDATPARAAGAILVCDDDPGVRTVVAEHLRIRGYSVFEADSGEQALEIAARQPLDAILLDFYLSGLTGSETLDRLKGSANTARIPVIIFSVLSPAERPTMVGDAQGWVQKPFNENFLFSELERVLEASGKTGRVLLVEGEQTLAGTIRASLEQANLRIDHASTRAEAIEYCLHARPDLIILGSTLTSGDGVALVGWLRKQPALSDLPLMVYSSSEIPEPDRNSLRLGPTQFLDQSEVQSRDVEELALHLVNRKR